MLPHSMQWAVCYWTRRESKMLRDVPQYMADISSALDPLATPSFLGLYPSFSGPGPQG